MGLIPKKRRIPHKLKKDALTRESKSGNMKCFKKLTISDFILITIQYRAVLLKFSTLFSVSKKNEPHLHNIHRPSELKQSRYPIACFLLQMFT